MMRRIGWVWRLFGVLLAFVVIAAACSSDGDGDGDAEPPADEEEVEEEETRTIGHVVAGDANDQGFYQGQTDAVVAIGEELGFEVIIVDMVNPGAAEEEFNNLARQLEPGDLVIGGGSELIDGFVPAAEANPDLDWVLVAGFPPDSDSYATVAANENEAHFMGGQAAALLLDRVGGTTACVVGGPDLPFVRAMEENMIAGLTAQDPDKEMLVTLTGDFEDAALATEALAAQLAEGCEVFYPYLGGALPAALGQALEAGIVVSATSIAGCGLPEDSPVFAPYGMSIQYNPSLYLGVVVDAWASGDLVEGEQFALYGVGDSAELGVDAVDGVGAQICDAEPEEAETLAGVREAIASGEIEITPGG